MKIEYSNKKLNQTKADCELVFIVDKKIKHTWVKDAGDFKINGFKGQPDELLLLANKKRIYVGIDKIDNDNLSTAAAKAIQALARLGFKSVKLGLYAGEDLFINIRAIVQGFLLGSFNYDHYKSKKEKNAITKVVIAGEEYARNVIDEKIIKAAIKEAVVLSDAVNMARGVVNMTPADLTPLVFSEIAREEAKKTGIDIKIHGEDYLKKQGMGAFLAVSIASPYPSQLIHLTYKAENAKARIVVVGKGLTYDSGGLSLKPGDSMLTMKMDEAGAAAVLGIVKAVAELKLPVEVHGIMGVTENMVGANAYKPDDILKAKNGKTIEVRNTDAEGRLVLADCLCYAQDFKPDYIVDIATLTGASMVALGEYTIALMGNDADLKKAMIEAGEKSGELIAELPFNKYLRPLMKSQIADLSNLSASKFGGAITAGIFLDEFIEDKMKDKWLHLDIAGPAYKEKSWGVNPVGATGAGVRVVFEWIKKLVANG